MSTSDARMIQQVVDTARFPLAEPGGAAWAGVVSLARCELADLGCCVLPGFIRTVLSGVL